MARDAAYRNAERKIEDSLRSRATELSLSGLGLTELPESLSQLTQLQSFELGDNQLTTLPESLGQLKQLQSLNLECNQLTALPEWLGQLTQLRSLNLEGNQLTALPEWLGQLTQLQSLDVSDNRLEAVPESLSQLTHLQTLDVSFGQLTTLPESLGQLTQLRELNLSVNQLTTLPDSLGQLTQLESLDLSYNGLTALPGTLGQLTMLQYLNLFGNDFQLVPDVCRRIASSLRRLDLGSNSLRSLPHWIGDFTALEGLLLDRGIRRTRLVPRSSSRAAMKEKECEKRREERSHANSIDDLPAELSRLASLRFLNLDENPLNPELAAAYASGVDAVKRYLRAKAEAQVVLNEAKLILIGEGEVGKSCLLGALRGDPWEEGRPTTHGIEIKPVKVTVRETGTEITLNGWDFGGQRVYRPTHQFFFSAPAVYLVVWKPREGPQQGLVKEWIKLVKHREPDAKILVVATHGGPGARQPDIDRQELWDLFGKETVINFFHVESRPPELDANTKKRTETGKGIKERVIDFFRVESRLPELEKDAEKPTGTGKGIEELRSDIARVAAGLPEMGRTFPGHWQNAREALRTCEEAYLPLERVFSICKDHKIEEEDARLLLRICRGVGDLIYFEHDPTLRDIVILKPDWLATAISFVLDDEHTREKGHGLVSFSRLGQLWNGPKRKEHERYPPDLHPVFLRLMERFDLSYRVAEPGKEEAENSTSLIAQLVPDIRPDSILAWEWSPSHGDTQQVQICRIVETSKNQSANAEGLFYQLIVRLHRYSLGRADYEKSVHWQRGLVLEDDTGARAFLEHIDNDVRITVRSPYPERFLSALTYEVKWLVESFWEGLRCEVTVPCLTQHRDGLACLGLFEVAKLIENKRRGRDEQPCPMCNEWHTIESLLHNAPAARPNPLGAVLADTGDILRTLEGVRDQLGAQHAQAIGRFDGLDVATKTIVSKVEDAYTNWIHLYLDEAKEGPRLFSFEPLEPGFFGKPKWISAKFKLSLWCEHSRVPLWTLAGDKKAGVYTLDLPREWLLKAAPFLKMISGTLGLVLPVVAAGGRVALPEADYRGIESELALGKATAESLLKGGGETGKWLAKDDDLELGPGAAIRADGAVLRQLHTWLKEKDPSFGGLVRVMNRRHEFLWVHPQYVGEY